VTHGSIEAPADFAGIWYLRTALIGHDLWSVRAYLSDDHPDSSIVGPGVDASQYSDALVLWKAGLDSHLRRHISVAQWAVAGLPDLWLVEVPDSVDGRPGCSIVAFATDHLPPGTVIANDEFEQIALTNDDQAGAMRWWADTGTLDQVFVKPDMRRRHIGSWLAYAVEALHQQHGWPGVVTVPGRRTDLGELGTHRHQRRMAPRTERVEVVDPETGQRAP